MALYEIPVIDAPWQRLETYLSDTAVGIELSWSTSQERWSMSLEINGATVLQGRALVTGVDMLGPYQFGVGRLFVVDWAGLGGEPGRVTLPGGQFRLIQDDGTP